MKIIAALAFILALIGAPQALAQSTAITLNVPTTLMPRVLNALAPDYQATLPDGTANPLTRAQTARRTLIEMIKQRMAEREGSAASFTAAETARTDGDTIQ